MIYIFIAISLFISIVLSALIIPRILVVAFRKKLFDIPDERKVHSGIIPRLGGISFVPTILFSLAFTTGLRYLIGYEIAIDSLHFIVRYTDHSSLPYPPVRPMDQQPVWPFRN